MADLREIPSVSELFDACTKLDWTASCRREVLLDAIREELSSVRLKILSGGHQSIDEAALTQAVHQRIIAAKTPSLKKVINATGIIVHTNLGRAPIAREALEHVVRISEGYSNLELNLEDGRRGSRDLHLESIASRLFPAEGTLIVNNNAAALLLILNTLSEGKEVIVSRGELVEIGGSFRLPEIMKKSGAILKEAGTTNRTRISDYRKAVNDRTGMILSVHPSNYQIIGFTERPALSELAALGAELNIPVVEDHGSGILLDLEPYGISDEPKVKDQLSTGIDLICFSGDKIFGGPQAGIICGKKAFIEKLRSNPLFRALRVDKMIYAAMEATLLLHWENPQLIPVLKMLSTDPQELAKLAEKWAEDLRLMFPGASIGFEQTTCYVGGGVAPMKGIPSWAVTFASPTLRAAQIANRLREADPPVVSRIENDRVFFELRTLRPDECQLISTTLQKILSF